MGYKIGNILILKAWTDIPEKIEPNSIGYIEDEKCFLMSDSKGRWVKYTQEELVALKETNG